MQCPKCDNELVLPHGVLSNCDSYGTPAITKTACCGRAVKVRPIRKFEITAYDGDRKKDDWGRVILTIDFDPELTVAAAHFFIRQGWASLSSLRRKFNIIQRQADAILRVLEEHKVIGPFDSTKPRKVLIKNAKDLPQALALAKTTHENA